MPSNTLVALYAGLFIVGCVPSQEGDPQPEDRASASPAPDAITLRARYRASEGFLFSPDELVRAGELLARGDLVVMVDDWAVPLATYDEQLALPISAGDSLPVYSRSTAGDDPVAFLDVDLDVSGPVEEELGSRDSAAWQLLSLEQPQSSSSSAPAAAPCSNGTWSWRWVGYCDSVCFACGGTGGHGGRNLRDRKYYCAYGAWYATNDYRCRRQCSLCTF
ncbi:MAG TPA: hypothetical protein VK698_08475 [Kofleriaceae bacterium]|nr:hypothetical protein [Kofleriaceae bacterium]